MTFAPPVSRDNFYYNGNLYVEVGNLNRHNRATPEEISAILRPDLKKNKKASNDPPKDQVGRWYEAQLIHYGLPPSKDKARAKMRLLEALNTNKLTVPPNITVMEAQMKKEYAAAERKAKAQHKASMTSGKNNDFAPVSKKRKQSEVSNGSQTRSPAKKNKAEPSKSKKKGTGPTGSLDQSDRLINFSPDPLPNPFSRSILAADTKRTKKTQADREASRIHSNLVEQP